MKSFTIRLNELQVIIIKVALKYLEFDLKSINNKFNDFNISIIDIDKIMKKLDK